MSFPRQPVIFLITTLDLKAGNKFAGSKFNLDLPVQLWLGPFLCNAISALPLSCVGHATFQAFALL